MQLWETRIILVTSISPGSFKDMCPLAKQDFLRHSRKKKSHYFLTIFRQEKKLLQEQSLLSLGKSPSLFQLKKHGYNNSKVSQRFDVL